MAKKRWMPVGIIVGAVVIAVVLVKTRKAPPRQKAEEIGTLVETARLRPGEHARLVQVQGQLKAAQEIVVAPQVSGQVVAMNPRLVPGGRVKAGETLFRIDPADYKLALLEAETALQEAEARLAVEMGAQKVAEREYQLFRKDGSGDKGGVTEALALREPQLKSAQAAVAAAKARKEKAALNLERTEVKAPFNALVRKESVDLGQVVGAQSQAAVLAGTDAFWVQASVPIEALPLIRSAGVGPKGAQADISLDLGGEKAVRRGHVAQILGDLDPTGQMARVIVQIDNPLDSDAGAPLLLDAYVDVTLAGPPVTAYAVPRRSLRRGDELFFVSPDTTLEIRQASILWRMPDTVLVAGLSEGDRLVTGPVPTPLPGMKLRLAGARTGASESVAPGERRPDTVKQGGNEPAARAVEQAGPAAAGREPAGASR